jgi:predicted restriction endonuclease
MLDLRALATLAHALITVDAPYIRWTFAAGPDEVPNGLALCAMHPRLFDHGVITVVENAGCASPERWRAAQLGNCSSD